MFNRKRHNMTKTRVWDYYYLVQAIYDKYVPNLEQIAT